jgi:non-ribosomal peptide synthetase component F
MVLAGLVQLWVARLTGRTDVVVGTATAGRDRTEFEPVVGLFLNTLALRTAIPEDATLGALVEAARITVTGALDNGLYPFDALIDALDLPRDLGRTPLFNVYLLLQNFEAAAPVLDGATLSPLDGRYEAAKFELSFIFAPRADGGLSGRLNYDTALFRAHTADRFGRQVAALLDRAATAGPSLPLDRLDMRAPDEAAATAAFLAPIAKPALEPAVRRFERHAAAGPQALAVTWKGGKLTYARLNGLANRLAWLLDHFGGGAGRPVGMLHGTDVRQLLGLLACLKGGSLYVPLDPAEVRPRLTAMLEGAAPAVLLADPAEL